jgi:hypothetical protein
MVCAANAQSHLLFEGRTAGAADAGAYTLVLNHERLPSEVEAAESGLIDRAGGRALIRLYGDSYVYRVRAEFGDTAIELNASEVDALNVRLAEHYGKCLQVDPALSSAPGAMAAATRPDGLNLEPGALEAAFASVDAAEAADIPVERAALGATPPTPAPTPASEAAAETAAELENPISDAAAQGTDPQTAAPAAARLRTAAPESRLASMAALGTIRGISETEVAPRRGIVQVGAFATRSAAAAMLGDLRPLLAAADLRPFGERVEETPERAVPLHRARFVFEDPESARTACDRLRADGRDCFVATEPVLPGLR